MSARESGFTLLELMIVTVVIAIIAAIAIPSLASARITSNETMTIANLNRIATAQAHVRAGTDIDSDRNGTGEYGFFQELSGVRFTRLDTNGDGKADSEGIGRVSPPVLSVAFGNVDKKGLVQRSGYIFEMYLPDEKLKWKEEKGRDKKYKDISAAQSERYWACYAWPVSYGNSGKRAFFVNQLGEILACSNHETRYSGSKGDPKKDAVLLPGAKNNMNEPPATGIPAKDGNIWRIVR